MRKIMEFTKSEKISLKKHPELTERWVQDRIAEDPSILGLGDVIVKDKEKIQPKAGRLDLLLEDKKSNCRYAVEIQLGATDESHIIRTIEYWDNERKVHRDYDHIIAVIIAEEITNRFFNVIRLFNGSIPLIAIQMSALKTTDNKVILQFITVLKLNDEVSRGRKQGFRGNNQTSLGGVVDRDEKTHEATDKAYWEAKGKEAFPMVDELFQIAKQFDNQLELKYNKAWIGLYKNGLPCHFVTFKPTKKFIWFQPRLEESYETTKYLENAGLDVHYRGNRYRICLKLGDIDKQKKIITHIIKKAFDKEFDNK
jgi:hypothetical protein